MQFSAILLAVLPLTLAAPTLEARATSKFEMCSEKDFKSCKTVTLTDQSCTKIESPYFDNLWSAKAGAKSYVRVYSHSGCDEDKYIAAVYPEGTKDLGDAAKEAKYVLGYVCTGC